MISPIVKLAEHEIAFVYKCHGYTVAWTDGRHTTEPMFFVTGREGQAKALERALIAVRMWEQRALEPINGNLQVIPGTSQFVAIGSRKVEKQMKFDITQEYRKHQLF
jgi:hypothetical protein